jgi:hypothetical protein
LEKKVGKLEESLILTRATIRGMPSNMTSQEATKFLQSYRLLQKKMGEAGYLVEK